MFPVGGTISVETGNILCDQVDARQNGPQCGPFLCLTRLRKAAQVSGTD
jgi:hypothetical protein